MNKITVTCGVCKKTMVVAEGPQLTQANADEYQQSTACDVDGTSNVQVVFETEPTK